ncbi:glycerol-3-phosphate acyltransferase [Egbenema bharatensis]|uniref:glycerol-3-phosphate acyltransferase n=1 Tax=Egbenema bharatensis TaxID=3463334 RepID=UPI003A8513CE
MTLTQVLGVLLIFILCPLLGGLPLIQWITYGFTRQRLSKVGTGNVSVSAAFYHGGTIVGVLAVLSEAVKGIAAVLLARYFFPFDPTWEVVALIALVLGRYWIGRGAGTTNVVWGYMVHDWITSGLVLLIGGVSFTLFRERRSGKLAVLILLVLLTALRHPQNGALIGATALLSLIMGWIYHNIPDDLELPEAGVQRDSRKVFQFFKGDQSLLTLEQALDANKVGQKAATLSQLKRWGYPVPMGWVLPPGDAPASLLNKVQPSPETPFVVRSSAVGEDSEHASAAGQYESILNVTSLAALEQSIAYCQTSYNLPAAMQYRQDQNATQGGMAVLVQKQVQGIYSGVAFSRDPIARQGDAVIVEGLPGMTNQVVSGRFTPEQYRVWVREEDLAAIAERSEPTPTASRSVQWQLPPEIRLKMEGKGKLPALLVQQVAYLARHLEIQYHGIPQDVEWTYDGQQLWVLQTRPITTLLPIWTRKIAAEVIPGFIHPLTWSINRPLTCGVWGNIFTIVLGRRSTGLNFNETATLHHSAAYFNASLLGQIFRRMGLPPESLEFLTRGAKFSKPPILSTLRNVPGLLKLAQREWKLEKDFNQMSHDLFEPGLSEFTHQPPTHLPPQMLLTRIYRILRMLKHATYFSIMAPLSAAMRQSLFKVKSSDLDNSQTPEVTSMRALQNLAANARQLLPNLNELSPQSEVVLAELSESSDGEGILRQFEQFLQKYGYLSEVGTDIAVPTWKENPQPVQELFTQFLFHPPPPSRTESVKPHNWKIRQVQQRLHLKGRVTALYSRLLAELRWSFVALEEQWRSNGLLQQPGDLFFLTFDEIEQLTTDANPELREKVPKLIAQRRSNLEQDSQHAPPSLVYGNPPPFSEQRDFVMSSSAQILQGIGASPGYAEGSVKVLRTLKQVSEIGRKTILVVPYTDSGWAPLLAQAGGLVAEVGGQLSHGAIVAREYGIPAVMNIHQATQRLKDGQQVRIDGETGVVEILSPPSESVQVDDQSV